MKNRFACIGLITAMFLLTVGIAAVMAASVNPTIINNFQSGDAFFECREVGCSCNHAYKFDNWGPETTFPWSETHEGNTITITSSNGTHFDWSSDFPISAVIVKGGTAVNIFYYDPAATSDTLLYAPINPNTEMPYEISHVTFCWNVPGQEIPEVPLGTVAAIVSMMIAFAAYFTLRKPKSIQL